MLHFKDARMVSNTLEVIIQRPYNATNKRAATTPSANPTLPFESAREVVKVAERKPDRPVSRRFPVKGTLEFSRPCSWTFAGEHNDPRTLPECNILVRSEPLNSEGMSLWIDQVGVAGYLLAKQAGCKILLDYGETVDIQQVVIPFPNLVLRNPCDVVHHWTVPPGFKCNNSQQDHCYRYRHPGGIDMSGGGTLVTKNTPLLPFPIIGLRIMVTPSLYTQKTPHLRMW